MFKILLRCARFWVLLYTIFVPGGEVVQVFDENKSKVIVTGDAILRGWWDSHGLWRVPVGYESNADIALNIKELNEILHNVFDLPSIEQTIQYMHTCIVSPTRHTWVKAIRRGNFIGWPLVTVKNVNKYLPESEETVKGHMNHQRQGVRSTKPNEDIEETDNSGTANVREQDVYTKVVDIPGLKGTIYTNQTGKFTITSRSGHKYVMVMVAIDSNAILISPMKNRKDAEIQREYLELLHRSKEAGIAVKNHVLNNEWSTNMEELIRKECKLELVPPGLHCQNMAELSIKAFKHNFISILSGVDASFPLALWDKLL